jgi:hypothetical protein
VSTETTEQAVEPADNFSTIHVLMARVKHDIGVVGKNGTGDVPYKFRSIDDVVNAVNPALDNHGVLCIPERISVLHHERLANGRAHMVMLEISYKFWGPRGDCVEASGIGESVDYSDKATNQAMSMAYKYMLTQTFTIRTADMTDADTRSVDIPEHGQQRTRSEAKPKLKTSARAAKQEAAETENLQPLMISEIEGGQGRQAFMNWLKKTYNCTPTRVPVEAKSVVEVAIVAFATGAVNPDGTPQLPEGLAS